MFGREVLGKYEGSGVEVLGLRKVCGSYGDLCGSLCFGIHSGFICSFIRATADRIFRSRIVAWGFSIFHLFLSFLKCQLWAKLPPFPMRSLRVVGLSSRLSLKGLALMGNVYENYIIRNESNNFVFKDRYHHFHFSLLNKKINKIKVTFVYSA